MKTVTSVSESGGGGSKDNSADAGAESASTTMQQPRSVLAQHSCNKYDWGTPKEPLERIRVVLQGIELDPASSEEHNKIVQAERYFTEKENGLTVAWQARSVFLNPPGGRGVPQQFFEKLVLHWTNCEIDAAIYLGYSLEQLLWVQDYVNRCLIAIPRKRIRFRGAGDAPTHGNFFLLLDDGDDCKERFQQEFSDCLILERY